MTLTTALWALGGLVLLVLAVQAVLNIRRAAPRRAVGEAAVARRVEPALGGSGLAGSAEAVEGTEDVAGLSSLEGPAGVASASLDLPPVRPLRRVARIDALIDAIAPLTLDAPVSGEHALMHLPPSWRAGNKPMNIEGLDTETGEWELPAAGHRYSEFQAGVQLANRSGALSEIEYSEFVHKVQAFADGVGAMPDFPDMREVAQRAQELDNYAGPLDAQLVALLRSESVAWSVGYVQQCAARHGFVASLLPGRLVLPSADAGGPPVLALSFDPQAALAEAHAAAVREVTLSLDVPQTPEAAEPYPAWQRIAQLLALDMGAAVVDDGGRPITIGAFDAIAQDIALLYRNLESHDLAAGSPAARRLFS